MGCNVNGNAWDNVPSKHILLGGWGGGGGIITILGCAAGMLNYDYTFASNKQYTLPLAMLQIGRGDV